MICQIANKEETKPQSKPGKTNINRLSLFYECGQCERNTHKSDAIRNEQNSARWRKKRRRNRRAKQISTSWRRGTNTHNIVTVHFNVSAPIQVFLRFTRHVIFPTLSWFCMVSWTKQLVLLLLLPNSNHHHPISTTSMKKWREMEDAEKTTITGAKKPKKFIKLHLSVERGECSGKQIMKKITRKVAKRSKHALRILEQKWRKSETIKAKRLSCNNIQANAKNMKRELL